jgi:chromate transporter
VLGALLLRAIAGSAALLLLPVLPGGELRWLTQQEGETAVSLWSLGAFFLKIGAILYGSGYVLVAYLEGGLVEQLGWLTQAELLDAIAIGQFTPGPVLTTATFVGFIIAGAPGAIVATVGIFLPSFLFVLVLNPLIPKMRQSVWLSAFLDAVNVAAVGLMVAVLINLGRQTFISWQSVVIALLALLASVRFKVNSAWIVLGGAVLGYLLSSIW